ncbi:WRKY Transcription Factor [Castilleja foliolosa]|uniref:WRKY Transcription Factor n=1 Tax=Castilleja foliolosa TaxID=1961234 RepID=A0ABD3EG34_9LAMI
MNNEDFHAKRGKVIMELSKGKQFATWLQNLLQQPADDGLGLAQQLALQILRSFTETLSEMGSCFESAQITAVDCSISDESLKKTPVPGAKRRGCYKRRKTLDSWVIVSSTKEDGCAWRKYGQKAVMSSTYPRCYFRCTHKHEGCKATKQVQRTKENPIMYQITYFNHHTCTEKLRHLHDHIVDPDHVDPNLISFEMNIQPKPDQYSPNPTSTISQAKEEIKEDNVGMDQDLVVFGEAKSTLNDPWQDIEIGLESSGYKPEWAHIENEVGPRFDQSHEATSLHGFEEANELGDIDYLWCF